jgi:hypothetical protein
LRITRQQFVKTVLPAAGHVSDAALAIHEPLALCVGRSTLACDTFRIVLFALFAHWTKPPKHLIECVFLAHFAHSFTGNFTVDP